MDIYLGAPALISPLGNSLSSTYEAMCEGKSGICQYITETNQTEYVGIVPETFLTSGISKIHSLLEDVLSQSLNQLKVPLLSDEDTTVIICTTKGNIDALKSGNSSEAQLHLLSSHLKEKYNLARLPIIVSSACISGLLGIINGARMIESGYAQRVLVLGADTMSEFTLSGFESFFATASGISKPYDKNRDGINLGEAAGSIVLSKDVNDFNKPLGKYLGGASANDANHISGPSRTGEGLYRSVSGSLDKANLQPSAIDYISAHGTATPYNDEMEAIAFSRLNLSEVPLNSYKGYLGHTLGAAGLVETILGLYAMQHCCIPASYGYEHCGVSQPLNIIERPLKGNFQTMLKTASGFGGSNAAAIFAIQ